MPEIAAPESIETLRMCDLFGTQAAAQRAAEQAAQAEQQTKDQEAKRQSDITAGKGSIDKAFSGFDQPYYDKYKTSYEGAYNPEIDRQFNEATDKITSGMAGRGMLGGTYSNWSQGEAQRTRDDARGKVGADAENAASTLKSNVNQRKNDMYQLNTTANDPQGIAAQATGSATSIAAPTPTTSLGSVFGSVLGPIQAYQTANMNTIPGYGYGGYGTGGGFGAGYATGQPTAAPSYRISR